MVTMSSDYQKNYYKKNKIKYSTVYNKTHTCELCDCIFTKSYMARHLKTKKHIEKSKNVKPEHSMEEVSEAVKQRRLEVKVLLKEIKQLEGK